MWEDALLPQRSGNKHPLHPAIPAQGAIVDGQVYYRENSRMVRPDLNTTAEARVKCLVGLRDCVQELIDQMCIRDRK